MILSHTTAKNMTNFEHCVLSILCTVCVIIIIISIIIIIIINQTLMVFRLLQTYVYLVGCSKNHAAVRDQAQEGGRKWRRHVRLNLLPG
jgi:uncharacterized membrane protein